MNSDATVFILRMREIIKDSGLSDAEFSSRLEVNPSNLSKMINGQRTIGNAIINKLVLGFGVNRNWFLTGNGEKYSKTDRPCPLECTIRLLPVSAMGGSLNEFFIGVKDADCERIISPIKDVDFAISVTGESMAPEYPSGSQVLIKKINENAFIEWGRVYVLDTVNGTIIKVITESPDGESLRCSSINPDQERYAPFTVKKKDIHGIYRVLLCMSLK